MLSRKIHSPNLRPSLLSAQAGCMVSVLSALFLCSLFLLSLSALSPAFSLCSLSLISVCSLPLSLRCRGHCRCRCCCRCCCCGCFCCARARWPVAWATTPNGVAVAHAAPLSQKTTKGSDGSERAGLISETTESWFRDVQRCQGLAPCVCLSLRRPPMAPTARRQCASIS